MIWILSINLMNYLGSIYLYYTPFYMYIVIFGPIVLYYYLLLFIRNIT